MNELKEGEAYSKSLDIIKSNPEISTILGEPIKPSFFIKGTTGSDKEELIYSISGTKEQADVYVFAENKRGKIVLKKLIVEIENISRKIEIIPSSQQSK